MLNFEFISEYVTTNEQEQTLNCFIVLVILIPKSNDSKIYNTISHRAHGVHRDIQNHLKGAFE